MWKLLLWLLLSAFVAAGAKAHELEEGTGMLCDTQVQIERFAALEAKPEAAQLINADANKNVCVMANVRYIRGREVSRVRVPNRTMQIVEILVVQVNVMGAWATIPPDIQYTIYHVDEVGA